jgi:hypothetical protein
VDTLEKPRLFVLVSLYRRQDLEAFHEELTAVASQLGPRLCLNLHLAARHFPSTWGRVSRAQPEDAGPGCLPPSKLQEWRRWYDEGRVGIVPAGYAGAYLPVLSLEEIRADVELALSNPWKSGVADCFGEAPALVLPFWPDSRLADPAAGLLSKTPLLGLGLSGGTAPRLLAISPGGRLSLPCLVLHPSARGSVHSRIADFLRGQTAAQAVVQLAWQPGQDALAELVKALAQLSAEGYPALREAAFAPDPTGSPTGATEPPTPAPLVHPHPRLTPDFRGRLLQLAAGRHGRSATQERLRSHLLASLPHDDDWRLPVEAAPEPGQRSLLANMEGEAAIIADGYEARFSAGVWQGFFQESAATGRSIRFRPGTGTGLTVHGRHLGYEVESSVSFETDHSRGLRNVLVLDCPECRIPGRIVTDHILTDHGDQLLVDVQLRYPWLEHASTVDEVQPYRFNVELPTSSRDLRVRRQHLKEEPDEVLLWEGGAAAGEAAKAARPRRPAWLERLMGCLPRRPEAFMPAPECLAERLCFGGQWIVSWEDGGRRHGLALFRLTAERASGSPMEFRLLRHADRSLVLEIFPEGRYHELPSADLRSLNHHFVVGIQPLFDSADIAEAPTEKAEKECAPFHLVRES